jgi:hypothetical protein
MKQLPVAILALFLTPLLRAADTQPATTQPFHIEPHWNTGDVFRYDVTKTQRKKLGDKDAETVKITYSMDLRILKADADGYTLEWYMSDTKMIEPPDPDGNAAKVMILGTADFPVRFRLTKTGESTGRIENWDQVCTASLKSLEIVLESKPADFRKQSLQMMAEFMKKPEYRPTMERATLEDAANVIILNGIDFSSQPKPVAIAVPVLSNMLAAEATNEIISQGPSQVVVRQSIYFDQDIGKKMAEILNKADQAASKPFAEPGDSKAKMKIVNDATIDPHRGLVTSLRISKTVEASDNKDTLKQETLIEVHEKTPATTRAAK